MPQDFLTEWLIGEAGAAWIIGILGILGAAYTWLRRERPVRIIVQELYDTRLLGIHPEQRDRLRVSYKASDGKEAPITDLHQTRIAIYNSGTRDITEPLLISLALGLPDADQHIDTCDAVIDQGDCCLIISTDTKTIGIDISLPFLNSFPTHKHFVSLYIISEQRLKIDLLDPVGKGWSAMLISLIDQGRVGRMQKKVRMCTTAVVGFLLAIAVILFIFAMYHAPDSLDFPVKWMLYGINTQEIDPAVASYKNRLESLGRGDWKSFLGPSSIDYFFYSVVTFVVAMFMGWIGAKISRLIPREVWGVEPRAVFERLEKTGAKRRRHGST